MNCDNYEKQSDAWSAEIAHKSCKPNFLTQGEMAKPTNGLISPCGAMYVDTIMIPRAGSPSVALWLSQIDTCNIKLEELEEIAVILFSATT